MELKQGYKQTEVGLVPVDWEVKKLCDISILKSGKSITSTRIFETGEYKCFGGNGLRGYADSFTHDGSFPLIGRQGALCGNVNYINGKFFASEHAVVVTVSKKVDPKWMSYVLNRMNLNQYSESSAQPGLSVNKISILPIAFPISIAEQTAIATALSDIDELISQTEKLIEKKKAIKQGVMQELLKPKEGWEKVTLGNVINVSRGGSPRPIQSYLTSDPSGINWIKIGDTDIESKYIQSANEKITSNGALNSRKVYVGDFILSNSMSFGRPYILNIDGCIHDGWLVLQNYQHHFDRDFLYYSLMSSYVLDQYLRLAAGSSVLNLNKEIVKGVNLLKPKDLNKQRSIANILVSIDENLDLHIKKLTKLKLQKQGMMQALLTGKIRLI
jgi:type I restriction enzyme, S subunit